MSAPIVSSLLPDRKGVYVLVGQQLVDISRADFAEFTHAKTNFTFIKQSGRYHMTSNSGGCSSSLSLGVPTQVLVLKYTGFGQKAFNEITQATWDGLVSYEDYVPKTLDLGKLDELTTDELNELYKQQDIPFENYMEEMRRRMKLQRT